VAAVVPVAGVEEEAFLEESNHSSQVLCRECHSWVSFSLTSSERVGALEVLSAAKVPLQAAEGEYIALLYVIRCWSLDFIHHRVSIIKVS
jgi:hypothetical protein